MTDTEGSGEGLDRPLADNPHLVRERRACSTCVFSAHPENAPPGAPLECRRHPPVVGIVTLKTGALPPGLDLGGLQQPEEVLQALTNFPSVQPDQWCGEYEPSARAGAVDG